MGIQWYNCMSEFNSAIRRCQTKWRLGKKCLYSIKIGAFKMLQIWILLSMLPTRTGKNPTSLMPTFQFQAHFKVTKCSNCWRSYHSGCWPDKWIKPGDIRSRNLVLTCENCTSNGEIVYDENLQYIFNKDDNSGILHTLIIQPDYLLSILNIEKCELKYLASPAAITRNKNHIKVTRKGDIMFFRWK